MKQMETVKNEVGMSWEMYNFSDLVNDITGGNRKFQSFEYQANAAFPIVDQSEKFISGFTNENATVKRKKDVVIFGDHTKALKFIDFDFCLGADGVKVLEPVEELDSKFLFYFLNTITLPDVGYSRHFKFLKETRIPLPPLPIQKRIAEILDAADALKRKDQELLKKYDELAQAIFIDMFGDPVKNEKGWETKKFKELGTLDRGVSKHRPRNASELLGGKYPLIQTGDVANSGGIITKYRSTYSEIGLKQSKMWSKGTLCITIAANIAKTGILDFDACFPDSIVGFKPNDKVSNSVFVQFWIGFLQKILEDNAPESAQKNINLEILRGLDVKCPPVELQNKFEKIIEQLNLVKSSNSNFVADNLFQTLIQKAFKGELVAE